MPIVSEDTHRKKGIVGRIKSKLTKTLTRAQPIPVASPVVKDLDNLQPEITEIEASLQQNEQDDKNDNSGSEKEAEHQKSGNCKPQDEAFSVDGHADTMLQRSLTECQQEQVEAVEQRENNDNDVDEDINAGTDTEKGQVTACDTERDDVGPDLTNELDDDDTLEVFEQITTSPRGPEHDEEEEEQECHEDDIHASSLLEPQPTRQDVDLVIVGVAPTALRNRTPLNDSILSEQEEMSLDVEIDTVTTPRVNETLSSSLTRMCPCPEIEMMATSFQKSDKQAHPPLHNKRDEVDSAYTGETIRSRAAPRRFGGRRQTQEAPILSSASSGSVSIEKDIEEKVDELPEVADTDAFDTGALISHAFGDRVVNLLAAEPWGDRQEGFDAIKLAVKKTDISSLKPTARQHLLCASLAAVQCGVEDRVAPVMFCALECFCAVLKKFARDLPDEHAFVDTESKSTAGFNTQLSSVICALVRKLGDSNKRTQREATQALVRIARLRFLRAIPHLLLHLSGREVPPRRQLETLRCLIQEIGLTSSSDSSPQQQQLTVETVLQFVAPSLKIAEEKTRKAAIEILADLQTRTNNSTAWCEQLARAGAAKPEMLRVINRRVQEVLAKREQLQAAIASAAPAASSAGANQVEEQVDREVAFPPAELVAVPQEDTQSSSKLLETSLLSAQNVVGPVCWRKLSSKTWSDRKEALLEVEKIMTEAKSDLRDTRPAFGSAAQGMFVAYCAVLHRALGDSIAPVVNTALGTFATLVKVYGPRIEWRETEVREVLLLTLLRLLAAMQKPNTRTTRAACRGILKLARLPNARHPLRYVLSCVFGGEGSSACDPQVQMHLLRLLVPEFGFQADGLGESRVLEAVRKGLTHSSARVRRSAADVALSAQRLLGREFVLARLQGVKPVTLKELEKSFVDGIGSSDRPHTVHATVTEALAPAVIEGSESSPVAVDFTSRRLLSSAPVGGVGRLQCTPPDDSGSLGLSSQSRASALSNEEEKLMDSILGGGDF